MSTESEFIDIHEKLNQELRRGALALAVLACLHEAKYGYALIDELARRGLEIDQGTLYPLLRRLEGQGLLQSSWRIADEARPRRYYVISPQGRTVLGQLKEEWNSIVAAMQKMLFG